LETNSNLISNVRLINQRIAVSEFKTAKEIVSWMGAMQAQDYPMSKWAIGLRLAEISDEKIVSSIKTEAIHWPLFIINELSLITGYFTQRL
jgi:hypothetical protein